jgi:hypothetical protein
MHCHRPPHTTQHLQHHTYNKTSYTTSLIQTTQTKNKQRSPPSCPPLITRPNGTVPPEPQGSAHGNKENDALARHTQSPKDSPSDDASPHLPRGNLLRAPYSPTKTGPIHSPTPPNSTDDYRPVAHPTRSQTDTRHMRCITRTP